MTAMYEKNEKTSDFAKFLRRLLDETGIFNRQEWAEFLDVTEPAISQWVHDQTLPRAEILRRIVGLVKTSSRVPEDILTGFEYLSTKPASEISPHSKRIGESIRAYLIQPLLKGFLASLARLGPDVQEKLLLRFSRMCAEEAGILEPGFTSIPQAETVKASLDHERHDITCQASNRNEPVQRQLILLRRNYQAAYESAKQDVTVLEETVPQLFNQIALYLLGSDEKSIYPPIRLFCQEALEHVYSQNNTTPSAITRRLLQSRIDGVERFSFEHTKQALNLLFLFADKTSVLVEDAGTFVLLDYDGSLEDAIAAVRVLGNRNVQYKLTERVSESYQRVTVKDGRLSPITRSDDVKAA